MTSREGKNYAAQVKVKKTVNEGTTTKEDRREREKVINMKKRARGEEGSAEESSAVDEKGKRVRKTKRRSRVETVEKIEREANKIWRMLSSEQEEVVMELERITPQLVNDD